VSCKHANDRASLEVTDVIEDLVDLEGVLDGYLDGVRGSETVELEGHLHRIRDKLSPDIPLWVEMVDGVPSYPCCETLVEPELVPPVHGDQVAEPLMSKLVGNYVDDAVLVLLIRSLLIKENSGSSKSLLVEGTGEHTYLGALPVCDETPVLHGTVRLTLLAVDVEGDRRQRLTNSWTATKSTLGKG
jgi:hypothetical protein